MNEKTPQRGSWGVVFLLRVLEITPERQSRGLSVVSPTGTAG
jgi:hypothetical protein